MVDKIKTNFYRAFEDRHRGSLELIKSRLRVYLPFVDPLCSFSAEVKAVDLGCGRGDWLELSQESGFDAQGVDLDDSMLVAETLRILIPGCLLILETPNPENIIVGTTNFYPDPTHQRSIPPLLLAFLPEHYEVERVKILRLMVFQFALPITLNAGHYMVSLWYCHWAAGNARVTG
ncbi:MAG: hypothetical protein ABSB79_04695 [Syntrophales bacterium]|jgi:O-antigen chain-terminating methyltransferase